MQRRIFLGQLSAILSALTVNQSSLLAAVVQNPWKIKMLSADTGIFTEKGGTILFHISTEGIVVVDAEFPEQARHLIGEIKKRVQKPFNTLINTHHHADHSSGNIAFKGLVYQVIAHENSLTNQRRVAEAQPQDEEQFYPDLVYTDILTRKIDKERITLHYFGPAHTNGDSLVHLENANIVHMGDLINNRRYPYIDRSAGASIRNWIKVLDRAVDTFDNKTTYVFGHASEGYPVYGKTADIRAMTDYFEKLLRFTESALKSGKSKAEFITAQAIPGVTEWVGSGIERSLTAAYEELQEK